MPSETTSELPARVKLPAHFAVYEVLPGDFRVQSSTINLRLRVEAAREFERLVGRLDGRSEVSALLDDAPSPARAELARLLAALWDRGILEQVDADPAAADADDEPTDLRLFLSLYAARGGDTTPVLRAQYSVARFEASLAGATAAVLGLGQVGSTVARALALAGVGALRLGDDREVAPRDITAGGWYERADRGARRAPTLARRIATLGTGAVATPVGWDEALAADALGPAVAGCDLVVLCPDAFRPSAYDALNQACLAAKVPWIAYRRLGVEATVGPFVIPGETACYKCFDLRATGALINPAERAHLYRYLDRAEMRAGGLPVARGADVLAVEALRHLAGFALPTTLDHVLRLDLAGVSTTQHPVLKLPRCPHCGPAAQPRPPIDLWGE